MPEGLPDQLWTNYETFFWDNKTGLFLGAALFVLGFTTFTITGFVSLCQRICCDKTSSQMVSENPMETKSPIHMTSRQEATSRQQLVEAEVGMEDNHQIVDELEILELDEEPTVIYENKQFFQARKQTKAIEVEDATQSEERRDHRQKYAYSKVIKKSNANATIKTEEGQASDIDQETEYKEYDPAKDSNQQLEEIDDTENNDEDYINVAAPRILSFGEELYMNMSQK